MRVLHMSIHNANSANTMIAKHSNNNSNNHNDNWQSPRACMQAATAYTPLQTRSIASDNSATRFSLLSLARSFVCLFSVVLRCCMFLRCVAFLALRPLRLPMRSSNRHSWKRSKGVWGLLVLLGGVVGWFGLFVGLFSLLVGW